LARRKERQAAVIHSTIALDQQFEHELEVFRTESETAAQFFYAFLAIHASAGPDKSVHRLLNTAPLFWNTVLGGLQAAAFVAMGRVFDQKSTHNVDRLLKLAQDNPQIFSKAALARRKQGTASAPQSKGAWQQAAEADRLVEGDEAGGGLAFNVLTGLPSPDQIESILGGLRRCRATALQLKWP
jgi:hypothetical protein